MTELEIRLERAYDKPCEGGGTRVLVDRIWPRGVSREEARVDLWLREAAPSDGLRRWFGHDPERWEEFRERYWRELDEREEVENLADLVRKGRVTLPFGARAEQRNNAVALKEYLERRL